MSNKIIKIGLLALGMMVVGGIVFYACKKDGTTPFKKNADNMRVFASWEAVYDEIEILYAMDKQGLEYYENGINFHSFGRKADAIYYHIVDSIMENNIALYEDLVAMYISQYPQYLQWVVDKDGENNFIPKYDCNPFRYIMNDERMFRVGDSVYKVFIGVILGISIEKAESLSEITEENIEEVVEILIARAEDEENQEESMQKSIQKPTRKFVELTLFLKGYLGGGIGGYKDAGWIGPVRKPIGGGSIGHGPGGTGIPYNYCPSAYGTGQPFTTSKETAPSGVGVVRAIGNVWIDIVTGDGNNRFVQGWLYICGQWHGGNGNSDIGWIKVPKSMSGNITMEICVDGNRYLSNNHTISGYQEVYQRKIIDTKFTSRPSYISITKINGQVCIPETCVTINKN